MCHQFGNNIRQDRAMKDTIKTKLLNGFLKERQDVISKNALQYQWEALNGDNIGGEASYAIRNLEITAGAKNGDLSGPVFQDSDLAKWIEASAYYLEDNDDEELVKNIDYVIDLYDKIQMQDGYFNTYYQTNDISLRFTNLQYNHELYCLGHMIEAAVAYYNALGKRKLLDIVCRYTDFIDKTFGPQKDKCKGYSGHEEIELALVKLYYCTDNKRYLELAKHFILQRGKKPEYFIEENKKRANEDINDWRSKVPKNEAEKLRILEYTQSHIEAYKQTKAVGHAVRALYLYSGMTDIAGIYNDNELMKACNVLWENVTNKQMYVTGGVGAICDGERFTIDYDLPNNTAYNETCAAIGLFIWAYRMFLYSPKSMYADIMEKTLYNSVLSGVSLDGNKYFYVNPLEVWPDACNDREDHRRVKTQRQGWFGCCCCPTNIARLMTSVNKYIYTNIQKVLYVNLFASSEAEFESGDSKINIHQETDYPWHGKIQFIIKSITKHTIAFRIPGWCSSYSLKINKTNEQDLEIKDGYLFIERRWDDDTIELDFDMPVLKVYANPNVRNNAGKFALQRGPVVYCLEETDNGAVLQDIKIGEDDVIKAVYEEGFLGGVYCLEGSAERADMSDIDEALYSFEKYHQKEVQFKAVPYYAWANRGIGEMTVWIEES